MRFLDINELNTKDRKILVRDYPVVLPLVARRTIRSTSNTRPSGIIGSKPNWQRRIKGIDLSHPFDNIASIEISLRYSSTDILRLKLDLWKPIAKMLDITWQDGEATHWAIGENEMARRAAEAELREPGQGGHKTERVARLYEKYGFNFDNGDRLIWLQSKSLGDAPVLIFLGSNPACRLPSQMSSVFPGRYTRLCTRL